MCTSVLTLTSCNKRKTWSLPNTLPWCFLVFVFVYCFCRQRPSWQAANNYQQNINTVKIFLTKRKKFIFICVSTTSKGKWLLQLSSIMFWFFNRRRRSALISLCMYCARPNVLPVHDYITEIFAGAFSLVRLVLAIRKSVADILHGQTCAAICTSKRSDVITDHPL